MLELSRPKVQQLISQGRLPAVRVGRSWLVSILDVTRFQYSGRHDGRPMSARTAWKLLLDAEQTGRVYTPRGVAERSPGWLVNLTRRRATILRYHALDGLLDDIAEMVVPAGETAAQQHGFAPWAARRILDGYITAAAARQLVARYRLRPAVGEELNVILRSVDVEPWPLDAGCAQVGPLVAALDMLELPIDDRSAETAIPVIERYL